jgi:hypothetical protein
MSGGAVLAMVFMLAAGSCVEFKRTSTGPTSGGDVIAGLSGGLWTSTGAINPNACGNFQWAITELTGTTVKGTFSATCSGGVTLTGTAEGTLNGAVLDWRANGTAQTPVGNCPFAITGTANLEGDGVRVNYTANTCVGTFRGSELLKKR